MTGSAAYGGLKNLRIGDVKDVANINICININNKGKFTGVLFNNISYTVGQWNKMQEAKPAGPFKER